MRRAGLLLSLTLLVLTGCNSTRWNWLQLDPTKAPVNPTALPSVASLVDYLNDNANRVRSLRVDDLRVTCSAGLQAIDLSSAVLLTEKPRNFRLKGKVLGSEMVDLGSNSDEFWFWIAKSNPPYQFYCPYKDLHEARSLPLPIQPDWIMETLGLGPYGPAERYQPLEQKGDSYLLIEKATSPQGTPVRKIIVMKRWEVKPPAPQVVAFLLQDDKGQEICSAHISQTQIDRTTGAILPRRIELRWPAERTTLQLRLEEIAVNSDLPAPAFVRPRLNGIDSYNLARRRLDSGLQPTAGVAPR